MDEIKSLKRQIKINNLMLIFLFGVILNLSVIVFNESRMPVFFNIDEEVPEIDNTYIVFSDSSEVNYAFLSDIFKISKLRFSIGDVLIFGSVISMMFVFINGRIKGGKNGTTINE